MADNYLEKKFEQMRESKNTIKFRKHSSPVSLDSLFLKNRSCRGYDKNYIVTSEQLIKIIEVNTKIPSARNQQVLRFLPICKEETDKVSIVTENIKLGGALPDLHLPFKGTEPEAYIIVFTTIPENKWVDIDLGISCQSMLLKAVEMGLNGICIGAFNIEKIKSLIPESGNKYSVMASSKCTLEPLMVVAIGKSIEKMQLLPISVCDNHNYFREKGIHFVPKLRPDEIIL
jgi:nitroreductase